MKKIVFALFCAFTISLPATFAQEKTATEKAQGPVLKFKGGDTYDMGPVKKGPIKEHTFEFTNTGTEPLIIKDVNPSCGCTNVDWSPKTPIAPGKKGTIHMGLRTAEQHGNFQKEIYIQSNAANAAPDKRYTIHIKGQALEPDANDEKKDGAK